MISLHDQLRSRVRGIPVTIGMIFISIIVFAAMVASGAGLWHSSNGIQLAWGANFRPATQDGEWWRLGTAMFLHFGVIHLTLNMVALWDGGQWAERMYGHWRFLLIYVASGLTGNLFSLVFHTGVVISGGASGAIFGVYGALVSYLWLHREHVHRREFRWLFWGAIGFSVATIVFGLLVDGIDNAAHIGGLIMGLICGMVMTPNQVSRRQRAGGAVLIGVLLAGLVLRLPDPAYLWSDEIRVRKEIAEFLRVDLQITRDWNRLLSDSTQERLSFDALASRIETDIADRYDASFEELAALPRNDALPSAEAADRLRDYAERRLEASRALADGLRTHDRERIEQALQQVQDSAGQQ